MIGQFGNPHDGGRIRVYESVEGEFTCSWQQMWVPGIYPSEAAAVEAARNWGEG